MAEIELTYTAPVIVTVDTSTGEVLSVTVDDESLTPPTRDGMKKKERKALDIAEDAMWPGWGFGW